MIKWQQRYLYFHFLLVFLHFVMQFLQPHVYSQSLLLLTWIWYKKYWYKEGFRSKLKWEQMKHTCLYVADIEILSWISPIQITHDILIIILNNPHYNIWGRYTLSPFCFLEPPNSFNLKQECHQDWLQLFRNIIADLQTRRHLSQLHWHLHSCIEQRKGKKKDRKKEQESYINSQNSIKN